MKMRSPFARARTPAPAPPVVVDLGDRVTFEDERWGELAGELEFGALDRVRAQAEGWRNGLGTVGVLAGGLTLVKGRADLDALPPGWRAACVVLWAVALAALAGAFLLAVRAAHGPLRGEIVATGRMLRDYSRDESRRAARLVRAAALAAVAALVAGLTSGVCFLLAPARSAPPPLVRVRVGDVEVCGPALAGAPLVLTGAAPGAAATVTAVVAC